MTLKAGELTVGEEFDAVVVQDLKRTQLVQYAGASGDYNPVHTDEVFATCRAGQPTVFAHGMLTMGMTGRALTDLVGQDRLLRFGARFTARVWPGDTLTVHTRVDALAVDDGQYLAEFTMTTTNQHDEIVLSGYALARIDP